MKRDMIETRASIAALVLAGALVALTAIGALSVIPANAGDPRSLKDDSSSGINWSGFYAGIQGGRLGRN